MKKPTLIVYTDGSIMGDEGRVWDSTVKSRALKKDAPISSAELKAIEITTNKGLSYSQTQDRYAKY
jgi:hypothetical protein